ncbi:MAG: hypothetical protein JO235_27460, partial [Chroococcidiopsidaceae cyanobacterium CP_BM_RX_35]|nr:hypothetical protein [Chroococcidiopsidaceae cyanobacterium CP_BM_RX_35]
MASVPYSYLKTGLSALKHGDYQAAIAHLELAQRKLRSYLRQNVETVCHNPSLPLHSLTKVQMGLVLAYHKTGEIERAVALCQTLTENTDSKVKDWADRIHADLTKIRRQRGQGAADSLFEGFLQENVGDKVKIGNSYNSPPAPPLPPAPPALLPKR